MVARTWELRRERVIDPADVSEKLLPAALLHPNPAAWFLLYITVNTGARISEVLAIRAGDLNESQSCLMVKTLKRRAPHVRQLLLNAEVAFEVRQWIVRRNLAPDDFLFGSKRKPGRPMTRQWARNLFNEVALAAGCKIRRTSTTNGVAFHGLRHANAVALMQGARLDPRMGPLDCLQLIKTRLGHSSLRSTMQYLHVIGEREVIGRMPAIGSPSPLEALPAPRTVESRVVEPVAAASSVDW